MSSDVPPPPPTTDPTPPPQSGNSHGFHGMDDFFDRIRGLGVVRSSDGRWAAGVASGLARRWDLDVVLVRGIFVALTLMGGLGVAAYGLCWLLLPQTDGRIHLQNAFRGHVTAGFVGAVLLALSAIGGNGPGPWHDNYFWGWGFPGGLVLTVLIIGGIWWFARRETQRGNLPATGPATAPTGESYGTATFTSDPDRRPSDPAATTTGSPAYGSPAPGQPQSTWQYVRDARQEHREETRQYYDRRALTKPSRPVVRVTLGLALLAAAVVALIGSQNNWDAPYGVVALATALGVVAVGVLVSGIMGRRSAGLAGLGVILTIATLIGAGAQNAGVNSGQNLTAVGDRTWRPTTVAAAQKQFNLGVGSATLWLTDPGILNSDGSAVDVRARMGVGDFTIVVPDDVATRVDLKLSAGEIVRPDGTTAEVRPNRGDDSRQTIATGPGATRIFVDVQQGVGQLRITPASRMNQAPGVTPTPSTSTSPSATPTVTATTN